MRKPAIYFTCSAMLLGICYYVADLSFTKHYSPNVHMTIYEKESDLKKSSSLVVTGSPISSEPKIVFDNEGYIETADQKTQFKIEKVIKDDTKLFEKGDIIPVYEPVATIDTNGAVPGKVIRSIAGYAQMDPDKEYRLYLTPGYDPEPIWIIQSAAYGKFNVDGKDQKEEKYIEDIGVFKQLKKEVLKQSAK